MTSTSAVSDERPAVTLLWRIKNFSYWEPNHLDPAISSPAFKVISLERSGFYLELNPRGKDENDKHMSLNLLLHHKCGHTLDCEWSFLDSKGLPLVTETFTNRNIRSGKKEDLPGCPTRKDVYVTRRSSFLFRDTLVVRCRLWKSDRDFEQAEHISAVTRINVQNYSFSWPIPGFSKLKVEEKVNTSFKLYLIRGYDVLRMECSLIGDSLEDSTVEVEIKSSTYFLPKSMTVKLSALDKKQKSVKSVKQRYKEGFWQLCIFSNFLSRKKLVKNKSDHLCNDVLTLHFEFSYSVWPSSGNITNTYFGPSNLIKHITRNLSSFSEPSCPTLQHSINFSYNSFQRKINSVKVLQDDFLHLYQEQTLSDFELKTGDASFLVHKSVLSARSPVFKAMLTGDMKESSSNSLDVPDLDYRTLGRMLTFMYAGTVEDLKWKSAAKLYYAADKYQIPTLKQECSSVLKSFINVSNVSDILALADRHQDEALTSFVHDFILSRFAEVMPSEEWKNFMEKDPVLAGKTTLQLCIKRF